MSKKDVTVYRQALSGRAFTVIGGGVVGLALARSLRKRGGDVLVVDARRPGAASPAAAGILPQPQGGRSLLARLEVGAHAGYEPFVRELERESGVRVEFARPGFAELALEGEEEAELYSLLSRLEKRGVSARWLDPHRLRALAPGINPRVRGALYFPETAWVHPPLLIAALHSSAERSGVEFREGRAGALERSPGGSGWEVVLEGPGGERIAGREVVVAAGAWTGELLRAAGGVPLPPIRPVRGQMVEVEYVGPLSTILECREVYVIPRPGGTVWVGATVEDVGFDERTTAEGIQHLLETARTILPDLGPSRRTWAGLRPQLLRRGGPLLGEGDPPALAGHYRSGIHLGPLTAHLLAARLAGERKPDVAPFEF